MTDQEVLNYFRECGLDAVDNSDVALYIMRNGMMIGDPLDEEEGERGTDHQVALGMVDDDLSFEKRWKKLHEDTGLVRYAPETGEALIEQKQVLTSAQMALIDELNADIERYV